MSSQVDWLYLNIRFQVIIYKVDLSSLDKTYESLPVPIDSGAPKMEDLTPAQLAQVATTLALYIFFINLSRFIK